MKKLSETYKELGIDFSFPIVIKDANGKRTYLENNTSYSAKWEYNANGRLTYHEDNRGFCQKWEYDSNDKETYYEDSTGHKRGTPRSAKTCEGKVVEVDGIKYKLTAL